MNTKTAFSANPAKTGTPAKKSRLSRARRTAILRTLADPHRFELLERIARASSPMGCAEARKALAISPATLSHHVKELETAGLVHVERAGKYIHLTLRTEVWTVFVASLGTVAKACCLRR